MKYLVVVTVLILSISAAHSSERKSAIGFGLQYGGTIGWQGSIVEKRHRGSVGFGLVGASLGYDFKISNKVSVGASAHAISLLLGGWAGGGIRMHYYPNGAFLKGWAYGLDLYRSMDTWSLTGVDDDKNFTAGFFSVGYSFK